MKNGLLIYNDSSLDLVGKVKQAARAYRKKHGVEPNACHVHPSILSNNAKLTEIDGITIVVSPSILRHHFWIGVEKPLE